MGFTTLMATGYVKKQQITAAVSKRSKGGAKVLYISIPTAFAGAGWDGLDGCQISLGDGDDAGLLRLDPLREGQFKIARLKHALVLRLPMQESWSQTEFLSMPLEIVAHDVNYYVLRLPDRLLLPDVAKVAVAATKLEQVMAANATGKPEGLVLVGNVLTSGKKAVRLGGPQLVIMMRLLLDGFGKLVRYGAFVEAIWGGDPNGGAEEVQNSLKVNMAKLRTAIEPLNLVVITQNGLGWLLAEGKS